MTTKAKVSIGIGVVVLIALLLTVLNKRWWIERIPKRWVTSRWVYDTDLDKWVLTVDGYNTGDTSNYTLSGLMRDYFIGSEGWHRVGTEEPKQPLGRPTAAQGAFTNDQD